ncbi:MAG: DUF3179 domain-containing protein [Balneolaceae bacterium]
MSVHNLGIWVLLLFFFGCNQVSSNSESDDTNNQENPDSEWLISSNEVVDGGPGKDGIPSIDSPTFAPAHEIKYVHDERLVIGLKIRDEIRAYPHQILDWHEIVNDQIGDEYFSLTYCPLTGTGMVWDRVINGEITEFGVSGLLFRNNLIAYDRLTDSNWSQMQMRAVNGSLSGESVNSEYKMIETTWKTWKTMYPESQVLTTNTGYARSYSGYTYGESYLTDDEYILFPVKNENDRLPNKTVVHAYLPENVENHELEIRVFLKEEMPDRIHVINEEYAGNHIVAAGSEPLDFLVTYYSMLEDGTELEFSPVQDQLPVIMRDQEGTEWNIFGEAVNGPRTGQQLQPTKSYNGYWFAISDFFPKACIYPSVS